MCACLITPPARKAVSNTCNWSRVTIYSQHGVATGSHTFFNGLDASVKHPVTTPRWLYIVNSLQWVTLRGT